MKSIGVTIQVKAVEKVFVMVLFTAVQLYKSVGEITK